jgi:putative ABC transport system ATP-binding protein
MINSPVVLAVDDHRPLIELSKVVKAYKTPAGDFIALKGIDAHFMPGEFASIIGKSGSGKSTMLNMVTGIDHPTSGQVRIGNTLLKGMSEGNLSVWRGRNLGIVFQFFQLLPMLSLLENTMLPMDFCNMYPPADRESRATELLKSVGLEKYAHKHPASISGGQQQCAAIARALANDPPTLIADEPTGNLDSKTAGMVIEIFEELVHKGKTILIVTHDITVARHASHMLILSDGELIDEQVERIFPDLSHKSMLTLTHQLKKFTFAPGQPIYPPGLQNLRAELIIVEEGLVQVCQENGRGPSFSQPVFGQDAVLSQADFLNPSFSLAAGGDSPLVVKMVEGKNLDAWRKVTPEAQVKLFDLRLQGQKPAQPVFSGAVEKVRS